ncbi:hypothetical protein [Enterococcus termitis]|nr:hypothetical protein [Enterococcus termitis]
MKHYNNERSHYWVVFTMSILLIIGISTGCQNRKTASSSNSSSSETTTSSSQNTNQTSSSTMTSTSSSETTKEEVETETTISEAPIAVENEEPQPEVVTKSVTEEEVTAFYSRYNRTEYSSTLELITRLYGLDPVIAENQQYIHENLMSIGQPVPNGEFPEESIGNIMGGVEGTFVYKGSHEYDYQMGTNFSGQYPENIFAEAL